MKHFREAFAMTSQLLKHYNWEAALAGELIREAEIVFFTHLLAVLLANKY